MKILNHLLMSVVAAATFGATLSVHAGEPPKNVALATSPRYLEEHPELLRAPSSREKSSVLPQRDRLVGLTSNIALANSPRFREEHPELRIMSSGQQPVAQNVSERDQLSRLTENKALAASPRFREEHPELLRSGPVFEIAPVK